MRTRERKRLSDLDPVQFVVCPECGFEQADMGRGVRCEECGYGPMPTGAEEKA